MGLRAAAPPSVVIPGNFTVATLPDPEICMAHLAWATDGVAGGCFMVSNGVQWIPLPTLPFTLAIGAPNTRSLGLGAALQATDPTKPALVTVTLASTSSNSLLSTTQASQKGEIYIASTQAGVTGATGTKIGAHENTQGGVLVVGLTITQTVSQPASLALPIGWWFGVRQTLGGNLTVASTFDQSIG